MCLAQEPQHSEAGEAWTPGPSVSGQNWLTYSYLFYVVVTGSTHGLPGLGILCIEVLRRWQQGSSISVITTSWKAVCIDPDKQKLLTLNCFVCLLDLILYIPVNNFFQLCRDRSPWVEPVQSKDKCVLVKDTRMPVRFKPTAPGSKVKHSTTEPLCSLPQIVIIFLPIKLNICFGCSKEPSHWDCSFGAAKTYMLKPNYLYLWRCVHSRFWRKSQIMLKSSDTSNRHEKCWYTDILKVLPYFEIFSRSVFVYS